MKIFSANQIREWEQYTIDNEPISSWALMERASLQCTNWIIQHAPTDQPIKIFCGKGNNGGDGLAIAAQLAERKLQAEVYILEFGTVGTADFQNNLRRLHALPVKLHFIQEPSFFPEISNNDLVIDALYGSGLNRPLQDLSAQLVQHINSSGARVVSIDLPSGMFADYSTIPHPVIVADYTLTFQVPKLCFLLPENEQFFGELHVLPIGLHPAFFKNEEAHYHLVEPAFIKEIYKPRKRFSHKGTYGHCLVIAGETGKMGAALLTTKACLRAGAGLVTALLDEQHLPIMQVAVPEAMVAMRNEMVDFSKYNSICIGPGLGTSAKAVKLVELLLEKATTPLVLDADALNILAQRNDLLQSLPQQSILTPHPKEFERLFGKCSNDYERLVLAKKKAEELGVIIILKGHRTAIAQADQPIIFNSTGNPGMATGGSGDVLTGIITALLAQGYTPANAAVLGVYLHGLSGDLAAKQLSEEALIAGDIVRFLGEAYKKIRSLS
ncbi:NAD(P)H-hydrate dehydratase [Aridibaculum aurantiacum]|uniref:NAD(P)H-hydrate dehydratase n=1 Tax=Aridibaculum aurantiacum TaxID=2810307 RepID=UPI001A956B4C|nr:NAD(P)H-hydrate dehydratase [Aridibaculum aurantiacum]